MKRTSLTHPLEIAAISAGPAFGRVDNGELPLPKPLRSATLTRNRRIFSECLLRAIFTTIGIGSVEFLRLEGLSRGPEAVARALDHASSWMERRLPKLIGRR